MKCDLNGVSPVESRPSIRHNPISLPLTGMTEKKAATACPEEKLGTQRGAATCPLANRTMVRTKVMSTKTTASRTEMAEE